ncbi:YciI family protein [Kitasatospora sp. HPMI-4]|uniref:YciI family protein n=1 Tax=Kitasatospora sp. HPMI-4 TaxID=3448443 RepID=UPI003F19976C
MRYLLIMHMNRSAWDALTEAEREEIARGHRAFQETIREAGEMLSTHALADPLRSSVVRVKDGTVTVTGGPLQDTALFLAGYYLVDCETQERAQELAAMIPDARIDGLGIEVRPVMFSAGVEM